MRALAFSFITICVVLFGCSRPVPVSVQPAGTVRETRKLVAMDAVPGSLFGGAVAISDDHILVGATGDDHAGEWSGAAYVFDAETGEQLHKLTASDGQERDFFGRAVCIAGDKALIGATGSDSFGGIGSGAVYIFDLATGEELMRLVPSEMGARSNFGCSISASGGRIIVGSSRASVPDIGNGEVYVFDVERSTQLFRLWEDSVEFGLSVSISGERAVVGTAAGDAYVFDVGDAEGIYTLKGSDLNIPHERFGFPVAISGDRMVVAAAHTDGPEEKTGAVFVFDAKNGELLHRLRCLDAAIHERFGTSLAMDRNRIIVGSEGPNRSDHIPSRKTGRAYVFSANTGRELARLVPKHVEFGDLFGECVAISGQRAVVGAPGDDQGGEEAGAVYVFDDLP